MAGLTGKRMWRGLSWGLVFAATVAIAWIVIFQGLRLHPRSRASPPRVADKQPPAPGQGERQVEAQRGGAESHVAAQQSDKPREQRPTNQEPTAAVLTRHQQYSGGQVAPPRGPERAALDESASELTTDFIPLGTCDDSQCMDEATLVRVTLPAEALLAFGLGTDHDFATEGSVQADVALGSDGVPFAIRFVD